MPKCPCGECRPATRRRLAECAPGQFRQGVLRPADTLTGFDQRCQLVRRELPQALESRMTRKRPDAHKADDLFGRKVLADPRQKLNEIQLIEEVVFEPQNQLLERFVTFDRGSPLPQVVHGVEGDVRRTSEMALTHVDEFCVGQPAWNGPFVERIRPDGRHTRNAGGSDEARRARAVRHVEKASFSGHRPASVARDII